MSPLFGSDVAWISFEIACLISAGKERDGACTVKPQSKGHLGTLRVSLSYQMFPSPPPHLLTPSFPSPPPSFPSLIPTHQRFLEGRQSPSVESAQTNTPAKPTSPVRHRKAQFETLTQEILVLQRRLYMYTYAYDIRTEQHNLATVRWGKCLKVGKIFFECCKKYFWKLTNFDIYGDTFLFIGWL